jgi:hypothetical protein
MIRLPLLALAALTLTGCNGSSADWNKAVAALTGEAQPQVFALVANDVPSVEPVVEPEPPCVPGTATYMNRFYLYDACTNELIGPDPRYW